MKQILFALAAVATVAATADIVPVSPVDGAAVKLITEEQRRIMAIPSYAERLAVLKADHDKPHDDRTYGKDRANKWRISPPLVLRWRTTAGEKGPWKVVIGTKPDLSDAKAYWLEANHVSSRKEGEAMRHKWTVPRPNLLLGQTYYWKVWSDIKCKEYSCGSTLKGPLNALRQSIARTFRQMNSLRSSEQIISGGGSGYRFNTDGNQVSYRCDVKRVVTINFDRNKVRKELEKLDKKSDETSAQLDLCLVTSKVDYDPPFDVNSSFAEAFEGFMGAGA